MAVPRHSPHRWEPTKYLKCFFFPQGGTILTGICLFFSNLFGTWPDRIIPKPDLHANQLDGFPCVWSPRMKLCSSKNQSQPDMQFFGNFEDIFSVPANFMGVSLKWEGYPHINHLIVGFSIQHPAIGTPMETQKTRRQNIFWPHDLHGHLRRIEQQQKSENYMGEAGVGNCPILGILGITWKSSHLVDHIPNGWVMFNGDI